MNNLITYLKGGDLRSIADADKVVSLIKTQDDFENLFGYLFFKDRLVVMRAADAIEKITLNKPEFLQGHNKELINLLKTAADKELKWHLVLIVSRLDLNNDELEIIWDKLTNFAKDKRESKIVRVNSLQSLFDLSKKNKKFARDFELIVQKIESENIPSINARLRKFKMK